MTNKRVETLQNLGVKEIADRFGNVSYRPQSKKANLAPIIKRTYFDKDNVRMYDCEPKEGQTDPIQYVADTYDRLFIPAHNKTIIPERNQRNNRFRK